MEFDPLQNIIKFKTAWHRPESLLQPRSHFSSLLIDKEFLCLGGIGKFGYALDDFIKIDLETFRWQAIQISNPQDGPRHVSSNAMCLVAYDQRKVLTLDEVSPVLWAFVRNEIASEGIYVFGGVKGEAQNHEDEDPTLYRLSIGSTVHKWEKPATTGPQPVARYQHSMHFLREPNLLLIVGGRSLRGEESMKRNSDYINDTSVLDMLTMEWSIIKLHGYPLKGAYGFASCCNKNDEVFIFGGSIEPNVNSQHLFKLSIKNKDKVNPGDRSCLSRRSKIGNTPVTVEDVDGKTFTPVTPSSPKPRQNGILKQPR